MFASKGDFQRSRSARAQKKARKEKLAKEGAIREVRTRLKEMGMGPLEIQQVLIKLSLIKGVNHASENGKSPQTHGEEETPEQGGGERVRVRDNEEGGMETKA